MTMENLCWFLAAIALVVTISLVRADECICPFMDGSANCDSKKLTEIPKCVTNRKEPVHSLYVLLSLCPNRHLANFLSGFVTGKAKSIGKIIATVDSQSFKMSLKWQAAALDLSHLFGSSVVCPVLFGFLLSFLLWCRLETTGLFGVYKPASNERPQFSISVHPAMPGMTQAPIRRDPCKVGNHYHRFAVAHVSPTTAALSAYFT